MPFRMQTRITAIALFGCAACAMADPEFARIDQLALSGNRLARHALVTCPGMPPPETGAHLLLTMAGEPLALANVVHTSESAAVFRFAVPDMLPTKVGPLVGWLIPADIVARTRDHWPADAQLQIAIDSLGPANRSAWLAGGTYLGIAVGDTFWRRVGGQPVARFDAILVTGTLTYTRIVPLVENPPIRAGDTVQLWPTPAQRRAGQTWSAVSYIGDGGAVPLVWIAVPPSNDFPTEPHVDYYRAGEYLGHGVIERRSERFWYARFTPLAAKNLESAPAVRPGDNVRIRTQTDIATRSYTVRVFDVDGNNALLNAGEVDHLRADDQLLLVREGQRVASFTPTRIQRSYAVTLRHASNGITLDVGDELWLTPPPQPPSPFGTLQTVRGTCVFSATVESSAPIGTPLAIRDGATTVGVGFVVTIDHDQVVGFALPGTLTADLKPGMTLSRD